MRAFLLAQVAILLFISFVDVNAQTHQNLSKIEINEYYNYVPLNEVYKQMEQKYGIKFKYNEQLLKNIELWYLFDHTPADLAIEITVRDFKLRYFIDAEGVVNIVSKSTAKKPVNLITSEEGTTANERDIPRPNLGAENTNTGNATNAGKSISKIVFNDFFNRMPMETVFEKLSEKYGIQFMYEKKDIEAIKVSNTFDATPATEALDALMRDAQLEYSTDGYNTVYVLSPNYNSETATKSVQASNIATKHYTGDPVKKGFPLNGTVRDKLTGESLPFVNAWIKGSKAVSQTNADGYFVIPKVPTDTSTILMSYVGYKPLTIYLTPKTPTENVVIEMDPAITSLKEVKVQGQKEEVLSANEKVSMLKLTPAKISTLPNVGEKDIFRAFQLLPGVSAANENSAGLYVRGGTPDQTLVQYDGFSVYYVDHMYGFFSAFNNNALKDVQLYKGGFPAKYGGRLSAVTEITGKEGNRKRIAAGGEASFLSANIYAEAPIGDKVSVLVAARRSYQGFMYNLITGKYNSQSTAGNTSSNPVPGGFGNRFGTQSTPSSYFYDLNAKVTYRPTDKDILTLSFYNGADDVDNSRIIGNVGGRRFGSNTYDVNNWGNTGFSLKWSRNITKKLYNNTLLSYSNYFSKRDRSQEGSFTSSDGTTTTFKNGTLENNSLNDYTFKSDFEWQAHPNHQVEFGTHIAHYNILYNYSQSDTATILNKNDNGNQYTFYAQDDIQLLNGKLHLLPGIRGTAYGIGTYKMYWEPRFSASYNLTDRVKLKGATGQYYQFLKRVTREDLLNGSREFWIMSNGGSIPISSAQHYIFGASYETNGFLFDVEAYYKPQQDISDYTLRITPRPGQTTYEENFYTGSALSKGIDFLIQKKTGRYNGWIGYTLGQTTNNFSIYGGTFAASQDVRHEFKMVNMYKWRRWDFSLTWIYASGKPYTSPEGAYQLKLLDGTTSTYINFTAKNTQRLPDYHRMDVSATYNFKWGEVPGVTKGLNGSIAFSIFNLYNRKNIWYKTYDVQSGQLIENSVTYMGLTPNVTFTLKY